MIKAQLILFGVSFLVGMAMSSLYRTLRGLDRFLHPAKWVRGLRDVLFGILSGMVLYGLLLFMADGAFHAYVLLGAVFGWLFVSRIMKFFIKCKKRLTRKHE